MAVLSLNDACLAFGHVALLDKAAFQLDPGERVALTCFGRAPGDCHRRCVAKASRRRLRRAISPSAATSQALPHR